MEITENEAKILYRYCIAVNDEWGTPDIYEEHTIQEKLRKFIKLKGEKMDKVGKRDDWCYVHDEEMDCYNEVAEKICEGEATCIPYKIEVNKE